MIYRHHIALQHHEETMLQELLKEQRRPNVSAAIGMLLTNEAAFRKAQSKARKQAAR